MRFIPYSEQYYQAVCDYLIALNRDDKRHINWNWARFEWMAAHPEFDKSAIGSIGLWLDGETVVGAAIYDMYFGEAFCGVLPGYETLYPEILEYSCKELKDDSGLGVAVRDDNAAEINMLIQAGFSPADQTETIMSMALDDPLPVHLPDGLRIAELDPVQEPEEFQWLLWQGFDHGTDKDEFRRKDTIIPQIRPHLDPRLSLTAKDAAGENAAYCCLWYSQKTDYVYVEPVCTVPAYRGKCIAKALLYEALNRAHALGAKKAYVISDSAFYEKLGFTKQYQYTFYWKR